MPCITHERGINDVFEVSARILSRFLRAVICISSAVEVNFAARGLKGLPLVTIYNGLDPAEMRVTRSAREVRADLGISPAARLIGIVGNIKRWKGQELVIQAMGRICAECPDVICLLIGDTPDGEPHYRREIENLIARSGLCDHVVITGFRDDIANYINALEVQIHASVSPEPFGRVFLEGMALRKPLVASNAGGVPEIVVDRVTGLLFEPQDANALAARVLELLANRALSRALGDAGRARLEAEFSIIKNVEQIQALYDTLLDRRQPVPLSAAS